MAFTTSPREYNRRMIVAKEFYKNHSYAQVQQMQDPAATYRYRLGELATKQPMVVKNPSRDGNQAIKNMEHLVGARVLGKAGFKCDRTRYENILQAHSPNAGMRQVAIERKAYVGERATQAKMLVDRAKADKSVKETPSHEQWKAKHWQPVHRKPDQQERQGQPPVAPQHSPAAGKAPSQSPDQSMRQAQAVPYTAGIKVSMEADKEYGKRLHEAQQYYVQHRNGGTLGKDAASQYKFELGKAAYEKPEQFRIQDKTGNHDLGTVDAMIGASFIAKGACNKEVYQKVLQDHSPNAGIQQQPRFREQYARQKAESSDKLSNHPKFKPERTKYGESNASGRAVSTLEERATQQRQFTQTNGRER